MDLRLLHAFIVLADCSNYRVAAKKLFVTQPGLTKQIKSLEDILGAQLFNRGRHGARLTQFGHQIHDKTRGLVSQIEQFKQYAKYAASGIAGSLSIGFGLSSIEIAPRMIAEFRLSHPDIAITLEDMHSSAQTENLIDGSLQLGFMRLPVERPLKSQILLTDRLVLIASDKKLPQHAMQPFDIKILNELPFLRLASGKGPGLSQQIDRFLSLNQITPNVVQQTADIQTLLALVSAGIGVAIVPEHSSYIAPQGLATFYLQGPYTSWDVGVVWNPQLPNPVRDIFMTAITSNIGVMPETEVYG